MNGHCSPREKDRGLRAKILNAVPAEERKGISLDYKTPPWKVSRAKSLLAFLRARVDLSPAESILYLEGGTPSRMKPGDLRRMICRTRG